MLVRRSLDVVAASLLWLSVVAVAIDDADSILPEGKSKVKEAPVFPDSFALKYTFSMPHFYLTQPNGLSYPVSIWYDGPRGLRRVEAYDGEDLSVSIGGYDYTVIPRINELQCDAHGKPGRAIHSPLPDLYLWEYGGTADVSGRKTNVWQRQIKQGEKVSQYVFYVTEDAVPVRMNFIGYNYLTNTHFDEFIYDFTHFQVGLPNNTAGLFDVPPACSKAVQTAEEAAAAGGVSQRPHPAALQLGALLPDIRAYDHQHAYTLWSLAHGRVHDNHDGFDQRLEKFRSVVQKIKAHNSNPDRSYTMRLNHWADWHDDEFAAVMLPNRVTKPHKKALEAAAAAGKREEGAVKEGIEERDVLISELGGHFAPLGVLRSSLSRDQLPVSVDWRGSGADPGVKDQGMCGSCYTFAATAAMEGGWFVATGQRRSFSEQQLVDCTWDYGNTGCWGGLYQPAFNYVADVGGIALEQEYSYRGEVGFCRSSNFTVMGKFSGYWAVESRNELALMEAVWKYGPVAVSVDAAPEPFMYYSEGVYEEPSCSHRMADLDHTVTLFGYGTTPEGKDYWLVRNSWAKFYGDDGYIKIIRGKGDCGIATDAAVPVIPEKYVVREAQEAARKAAATWD